MKTCKRCGKKTDMPFHTCGGKPRLTLEDAAKIAHQMGMQLTVSLVARRKPRKRKGKG